MNRPNPQLMTLQSELRELADPETTAHARRFFKTGRGEYWEGDCFRQTQWPIP